MIPPTKCGGELEKNFTPCFREKKQTSALVIGFMVVTTSVFLYILGDTFDEEADPHGHVSGPFSDRRFIRYEHLLQKVIATKY